MVEFSVIIPTYNNASKISGTIQSVLKQSFQDWEIIIVDDGSTDDTEKRISSLISENANLYFQKQKNRGVAFARNSGAKLSKGKFITFIDSDDTVTDQWLADFHNLAADETAGYLSCGYKLNGKHHSPRIIKGISSSKYSSLAGTFALKKEVFDQIGGYDTNLKQSENWELTARALEFCQKNNLSILHTDKPNFIWQHEKSPGQTRQRDEYRAQATLYLYEKYSDDGVFHFKKDDFIISSAVNFTRAGKFKEARKIFYRIFKNKPSLSNFLRILVFETPVLRRKKWMRKPVKH